MALSIETLPDLLRTVHDERQDLASRFKAALDAIQMMNEPIVVQIVNYADVKARDVTSVVESRPWLQ